MERNKARVTVLFNGFSVMNETKTEMLANCTCSLIQTPENNIIVDTMTMWDTEKIKEALKDKNLTVNDINWVISTHGHSDHIGNNNLFQKAKQIVGNSISYLETYYLHDFDKNDYVIDDYVKVISTPGHTLSDVSVIVKILDLGTVAIVGDLFEKEEDFVDEKIWLDAGSEDPDRQRSNRRKIVEMADYIIPGHGPKFRVTDMIRNYILYKNLV